MTRFQSTLVSKHQLLRGSQMILAALLLTLPAACASKLDRPTTQVSPGSITNAQAIPPSNVENRAAKTLQKLVQFGPRVAGTPATQQASQYLIDEYRKAGYQAEIQTFTYSKFEDSGSSLTIDNKTLKGRALNDSIAGKQTARLVVVPNVGKPTDFATTNVKGAIAIVRRGEIPFAQKAQNAANAGAIGLVIVNRESENFRGTLSRPSSIPVLALSGKVGNPLIDQAQKQPLNASLNVNTQQRTVTGRNVIAHLPGVTQPKLLLGGHYDSVAGSPGANDNASGTAVVLETARQLAKTPLARQAWFVAFDGEEDGLRGSRAFVDAAQPQFLSSLKAMFNFDMVGVNDRLQIGGSPSLSPLAQSINPGNGSAVNGVSDHAPFAAKNVPILFFHRGQEPNYHTPNDKAADSELLNQTTQTALNLVRQLLIEI